MVVEDWINGLLACLAAGLVVLTHKRTVAIDPWILYCPVIVLMTSFYPLSNALFGFNLTWYMALAAAAGTLYVLDRPMLTGRALALAVVIATVGSYSSLQGLLIWPAGIALLYFRGRSLRLQAIWVLAMVVITAVYLWGFDFAGVDQRWRLGQRMENSSGSWPKWPTSPERRRRVPPPFRVPWWPSALRCW